MANFGAAFRQTESFGVGGLLQENAHVYYDTLFSSRHVGRVSDLIASCLKDRGMEEVKLRAMILFGFFEAFGSRSNQTNDPIVVECGLDEDKVAVAVGFETDLKTIQSLSQLPERLRNGAPSGRFDELIAGLQSQSNHVVIRFQAASKRVEVVGLLGLPGKISEEQKKQSATVQLVEVPPGAQPAVAVAKYTQLGDLDHRRLLPEDSGARGQVSTEEEAHVSGEEPTDDGLARVTGGPEFLVDAETVEGSFATDAQARLRMEAEELDDRLVKVEGAGIRALLKRIWPFRKRAEGDQDEQDLLTEIHANASSKDQNSSELDSSDPQAQENVLGEVAQELEQEIGGNTGFSKRMEKAQRDLATMRTEFGSERARAWADGLMRDVLGEKARLHDLAKRLGATVRQKELAIKSKEKALQLEVKQRDELLHQKELALTRARDQISHINLNLERMRQARGITEDGRFKQKFTQSQRLLEVAKEENRKLARKAEELKRNLNAAQIAATRQRGPSAAELLAMKKQQDLAQKQLEEYKKANQLLLEKLNAANTKRDAKNGSDEENRKRLDTAMKMLTAGKQENQQLNLRLQRSEQDRVKLQKQLEDVLARLRSKGRAA